MIGNDNILNKYTVAFPTPASDALCRVGLPRQSVLANAGFRYLKIIIAFKKVTSIKAVVVCEMGSFSVEELSIDAPSMGALKIRMKATGICHSDLFVIDGRLPLPLPCVIGHEGAGTNNAKIEPSSSVVILGCGGVGLFIIQGAKLAGANKIIAIDIADNKLKRAQHFGATHLINSERYAPVETVHEITGKAADYAFEAVGIPKLMEQADEAVPRGGTAIIVGIAALTDTVSYNAMVLVASTKAIKGCIYGDANPPVAFPRLIDLYKSGKLNLDDMVSRTYSIDEAPHAFEDMKNNANARGVIVF